MMDLDSKKKVWRCKWENWWGLRFGANWSRKILKKWILLKIVNMIKIGLMVKTMIKPLMTALWRIQLVLLENKPTRFHHREARLLGEGMKTKSKSQHLNHHPGCVVLIILFQISLRIITPCILKKKSTILRIQEKAQITSNSRHYPIEIAWNLHH